VEGRLAEARSYLAPVAAELAARGLKTSVMVERGEPVAKILGAAREVEADLIAMTTHGRSGLGRLLFGSVAEAVLRDAETPVFLMKLTKSQIEARVARGALR
jgi:nucleotide-binding universal stress UspA family protein